jgi:hypothetical protein
LSRRGWRGRPFDAARRLGFGEPYFSEQVADHRAGDLIDFKFSDVREGVKLHRSHPLRMMLAVAPRLRVYLVGSDGGVLEGRHCLPLAALNLRINAQLNLAANFLRHFARLCETDLLAAAKSEVASYTVLLDPAHPTAFASRPFEAHEAVAETHAPLFFLGLRRPVRSAFHPSDHKICSHIGKNVGLDHVGRTGIRIASQTRSYARVSETVRERVGLKPGGQGGIRTHGELPPTAVFKTAALNHSATCPRPRRHSALPPGGKKNIGGSARRANDSARLVAS